MSAETVTRPSPTRGAGGGGARRVLGVLRTRLLQMIPTLIGLTLVTFVLVRLLPGGPAQALAGVRATPAVIEEVNRRLGLDASLPEQYARYLGQLVRGDLGDSFISGASVNEIIGSHIGVTIVLILYGVVLALLIGVPLAIVSAYRRGRWQDQTIRGVLVLTFGMPSFWVGMMLIAYLSLRLKLFPPGGAGNGFGDMLHHLFLPALTLALTFLVVLVRSLRSRLIEITRTDYVDAVRLKGVSGPRLLLHHVLRAGMVPVVALVGLNMSFLLGTSVVVENVFAIDGIGQQLVTAILKRDFLVVQGIVLVFGILVVVIGVLAELAQAALDPRITGGSRG